MDFMDDTRFVFSCPDSAELLNASLSVVEKDRFRLGERNEAGDRDCRSGFTAVAIDVCIGASLLSLVVREPVKL